MDDIFYFSAQEINALDLYSVLKQDNKYKLLLIEESNSLQVALGKDIIFQIAGMSIKEFPEPEDVEIIKSTNVVSSFCISHHRYDLSDLKKILSVFLESFGGWVGNDSDAFAPRYSLDDLHYFKYE